MTDSIGILDAGYSMLLVRFRLGATVRTGVQTRAVLPASSIEYPASSIQHLVPLTPWAKRKR